MFCGNIGCYDRQIGHMELGRRQLRSRSGVERKCSSRTLKVHRCLPKGQGQGREGVGAQ